MQVDLQVHPVLSFTSEIAAFIQSKIHRRNKAKRASQKAAAARACQELRVRDDVQIPPHLCKRVLVDGALWDDKEYMVERTVIGSDLDIQLIIPNTLVSSKEPHLPVSNPTSRPRLIKKGTVLAEFRDADGWLDKPETEGHWEEMTSKSLKITALIAAQREILKKDSKADEGVRSQGEDDLEQGPKTVAVPEMEVYSEEEMEQVLDVGELPEEWKDTVWKMLKKQRGAFAFDERLGHLDTKVKIRTKEDVEPISVPMYGSSPAKRKVIDEQLDKWFE